VTVGPTPTQARTTTPVSTPDARSAAKAAEKCQKAIKKVGAAFVQKRLQLVGRCTAGIFKCIETVKEGEAQDACVATAGARCTTALTKGLLAADTKLLTRIGTKCAGLDVATGLRSTSLGLGYQSLESACTTEFASGGVSTLGEIAACVLAQHACRAEQLFEIGEPRAQELLARGQVAQALRDGFGCLTVHAGPGAGVVDTQGVGKALVKCVGAMRKAGTRFVSKKLRSLERCVDAVFVCEQSKRDDAKCPPKASATCVKAFAQIADEEQKLQASVAAACPAELYAKLRGVLGANLDVLAAECARYGVADLGTAVDIGAYAQCLARQHECRVEELMEFEAPRAAALIASLGLEALNLDPAPQFPSDFCPTPSLTPTP
jgi:hypothetical protein